MSSIGATLTALKRDGQTALIPFLTAGDPDLATTEELIHALVEAGADLIELGMPFSDPMADGPTIQAASERALLSGTTLVGVLKLVTRVREKTNIPIVLMGYYNPVFRFGPAAFARAAARAGVDGLLLVDVPLEEADEIQSELNQKGIDLISLLAPTTPTERMQRLTAAGEGYLYYVSMTGVTGTQRIDATAIASEVRKIQEQSPVPVAVGFGITTPTDAAEVARFADAVVVGSALVKIIETHGKSDQLLPEVRTFIRSLKEGMREVA
jgi:tryptophan synthase alpha chain